MTICGGVQRKTKRFFGLPELNYLRLAPTKKWRKKYIVGHINKVT
jgi:hypothetical protein